jgi:hypothetical protein
MMIMVLMGTDSIRKIKSADRSPFDRPAILNELLEKENLWFERRKFRAKN